MLIFNFVAGRGQGFPISFRHSVPWRSGSRELVVVTPFSALKMGAVIGAVLGLLGGVFMFIMFGALAGAVAAAGGGMPDSSPYTQPTIILYMLLLYPLAMGGGGAISALLYNALASSWGGIKFETTQAR